MKPRTWLYQGALGVLLGAALFVVGGGCSPPASDGPISVVATNGTDLDVRLTLLLDGLATDVSVAAGESTTVAQTCPALVVLVSQTLGSGDAAVETSFAEDPNARLARDTNFVCGDRITIAVGADTTTVTSQAGQ